MAARCGVTGGMELLDERSEPTLRTVIGGLMAEAESADFAVARIRLAALDLGEHEIAVPSCRVLVGKLDASTLDLAEGGGAARRDQLVRLLGWVRSGRLQVRSAGIGGWTPDFSVFRSDGTVTCLVGAHYFGNPYPTIGPSLTCLLTDTVAGSVAAARFAELWGRSHDVMPAIRDVLERPG